MNKFCLIALFFIFFILQSDKDQISSSLNSHFQELRSQQNSHQNSSTSHPANLHSHLVTASISPTTLLSPHSSKNEVTTDVHEIHPDKCANEWREEKLIGRCFGLKSHSEYELLKDVHFVDSSQHCRELCCTLGNQCLTWQYWIDNKICKLGGIVRYGTENQNTANWCDPEGPVVWEGKRIESKNDGNVEIGPVLTTQCFGLGPLRTNADKTPLQKDECSKSCLLLSDCKIWQWHERRGCYYTNNPQVYCDPYAGGYDGGRKIFQS